MLLFADVGLLDGQLVSEVAVRIQEGVIVAAGPAAAVAAEGPPDEPRLSLGRKAILPGTVNAHNHSFQSLLRGFGDDLPFLAWRERALYRFSPRLGKEGVYTGALFAFAEMLLHGVTTVCDFFYLNDGANENARAVIAAAQALGIRIML